MATSIDHNRSIRDCLEEHRQAIVTQATTSVLMVAQRYSKRISTEPNSTKPDKAYCAWQDELGHQRDHPSIESLRFVRAL